MKSLSFVLTLFFCTCLLSVNAQTTTGCSKSKAEVTACKKMMSVSASTASLTKKAACGPKEACSQPCPLGCCTSASASSNSVDKLLQAVQVMQVNQTNTKVSKPACKPASCEPSACKSKAKAVSTTALVAKS